MKQHRWKYGLFWTITLFVVASATPCRAQVKPLTEYEEVTPTVAQQEPFGLVETSRILQQDGLDRQYLRYLRRPGAAHSFAEYLLNRSNRGYRAGKRLMILGGALMGVSVPMIVGGTVWMQRGERRSEEASMEDDYNSESDWGGFLGFSVLIVGVYAAIGGVVMTGIGGYKVNRYGEWRKRLSTALGKRLATGPAWHGVRVQLGKEQMFWGTGVTF